MCLCVVFMGKKKGIGTKEVWSFESEKGKTDNGKEMLKKKKREG